MNAPEKKTLKRMADIIQSEVGYFNGWSVSDKAERDACEMAAKRIIRYLNRIKREVKNERA